MTTPRSRSWRRSFAKSGPLTYLIGNQQVMRGVLIVVTFRSDELHRGHPLRPLRRRAGPDRLGPRASSCPG